MYVLPGLLHVTCAEGTAVRKIQTRRPGGRITNGGESYRRVPRHQRLFNTITIPMMIKAVVTILTTKGPRSTRIM
jgi:hypothetical protein